MSTAVREEIAAAATTVDGVQVFPYFIQTTEPGWGMVRRDRVTYPNKFGGITTWQVVLFLPQDLEQAERWWDETVPAIVTALTPALTVTDASPQQLALPEVGTVPICLIQGNREE